MLYISFLLCVATVIYFSINLSNCADWFEKNTKMSGAIIGFVLAATTSIPELVSGITAVAIGQEELAISSILGSNLFNVNIVVISNLVFISYMAFNNLSKTSNRVNLFILSIYGLLVGAVFIGYYTSFTFFIERISLVSVFVMIVYFISVYYLKDDDEGDNEIAEKSLIIKKTFIALAFATVLIIASSLLAKLVELIMLDTGMSASFAGSLLLGASTSLPELVGAFTLMRMKQYDIAVTSVLSSNLFNFFVLGLLDVITADKIISVFNYNTYILLFFGTINMIIITVAIRFLTIKNKFLYSIPSILVLISYCSYLVLIN